MTVLSSTKTGIESNSLDYTRADHISHLLFERYSGGKLTLLCVNTQALNKVVTSYVTVDCSSWKCCCTVLWRVTVSYVVLWLEMFHGPMCCFSLWPDHSPTCWKSHASILLPMHHAYHWIITTVCKKTTTNYPFNAMWCFCCCFWPVWWFPWPLQSALTCRCWTESEDVWASPGCLTPAEHTGVRQWRWTKRGSVW